MIAHHVYDLLRDHVMLLNSFEESISLSVPCLSIVQYQPYGRCAFFDISLFVMNHNQISLHGAILLSMDYGYQKVPIIMLKREKCMPCLKIIYTYLLFYSYLRNELPRHCPRK